jgi:predicted ATPase
MRFTRLKLSCWRNFLEAEVAMTRRVFIYGPNAAGKSNLVDALRFLQEVAAPGGGLRRAVERRRGVGAIRALHAPADSGVGVEIEAEIEGERWRYELVFRADKLGHPVVRREVVRRGRSKVLSRPTADDRHDPHRLTQTHLEQAHASGAFRPLARFLAAVDYTNMVPQIVRGEIGAGGRDGAWGSLGGGLVGAIAREDPRHRKARLGRVQQALRVVLPQFDEIAFVTDELGAAHLRARHRHWQAGSWQQEEQFSDGTLRLLAALWAMSAGATPLILEGPEQALHEEVVRQFPALITHMPTQTERQVIVTTHATSMLQGASVEPEEIILVTPAKDDTMVRTGAQDSELRAQGAARQPLGEIVLARTAPELDDQLSFSFLPRSDAG